MRALAKSRQGHVPWYPACRAMRYAVDLQFTWPAVAGAPPTCQRRLDSSALSRPLCAPLQILDVASASGEPAVTLARALPQARVVSTDFAETYLELGQVCGETLSPFVLLGSSFWRACGAPCRSRPAWGWVRLMCSAHRCNRPASNVSAVGYPSVLRLWQREVQLGAPACSAFDSCDAAQGRNNSAQNPQCSLHRVAGQLQACSYECSRQCLPSNGLLFAGARCARWALRPGHLPNCGWGGPASV